MALQHIQDRTRGSGTSDRWQYNLLFSACLAVCLPSVALSRALQVLRGRPAGAGRQSVYAEAKSAAGAATGYAFMA